MLILPKPFEFAARKRAYAYGPNGCNECAESGQGKSRLCAECLLYIHEFTQGTGVKRPAAALKVCTFTIRTWVKEQDMALRQLYLRAIVNLLEDNYPSDFHLEQDATELEYEKQRFINTLPEHLVNELQELAHCMGFTSADYSPKTLRPAVLVETSLNYNLV
jgi:hypothetical protein